ncbi:HNH endonuclease signature motif containing protein [Autumnicola musiva]|uniref:HNH endonuclease signature motif containing protein n=1 Tax=Autumnicola musiva TaxID=3075589 RepID=A0ABU3D8G3_9FLAO|nr:HNH endonuclease signature motif containing protein [Zunongwangia sp. F117]MDT0677817.1 HNH endonuclease signature motif containing protein [Zunongwangia sp. F117]
MIKDYRQEVWKKLHKEEWQDRFVYKVSNYGRVISYLKNPEGDLMKGGKVGGYLNFAVRLKNGKSKTYYVHRIVAELFLKKKDGDKYVIHKNFEKDDNKVSNLAWATKEEWVEHQYHSPSVKENKHKRKLRKVVSYSKLSYAQAVILKKKLLDPNRKTRIKVLAKQFGVSEMQLYRIKSGENWGDIEV